MRKKFLAFALAAAMTFASFGGILVKAEDLSVHTETSGDFTAAYSYENPFKGQDTSVGVSIEFKAVPNGEMHVLGTIFSILGSGDFDGRMYFTPGSYLGYNSGAYGGFFDANLKEYTLVQDYIGTSADIKIEITPSGFAVYANDTLCYDQTILSDAERAAGDFKADSDFTPILNWLAGADTINFGAGSWWNAAGADEANVDVTNFTCKLADGTVLGTYLTEGTEPIKEGTEPAPEDGSGEVPTITPVDLDSVVAAVPEGYTALYRFNGDLKNEVTGESATTVGTYYNQEAKSTEASFTDEAVSGKALWFKGYGDGVKLETVPASSQYTISVDWYLKGVTQYTPGIFFANMNEDGTIKGDDTNAEWISIAPLGWQTVIGDGPMIWSRNVPDELPWNDLFTAGNNLAAENTWFNVTVAANGAEASLYVNGTKIATGPIADIIDGTTEGYLGINAWDAVFNGYMDNLYLYDRTLTDEEVASLAKAALTNNPEETAAAPTEEPTSTPEPTPTQEVKDPIEPTAEPTVAPASADAKDSSSSTVIVVVIVVVVVAAIAVVIVMNNKKKTGKKN